MIVFSSKQKGIRWRRRGAEKRRVCKISYGKLFENMTPLSLQFFGVLLCNSICSFLILQPIKRKVADYSFVSALVSKDKAARACVCVCVCVLISQGQIFMRIHPTGIMDAITHLGYWVPSMLFTRPSQICFLESSLATRRTDTVIDYFLPLPPLPVFSLCRRQSHGLCRRVVIITLEESLKFPMKNTFSDFIQIALSQ